jgi:geranylgeranyl diphosphate synthase type II
MSHHILDLEAFRQDCNQRLERLYDQRQKQAETIDPNYGRLISELRSLILRGGKRLRPYLTYLTYIGLGGESEEAILDLVASQELFHNFLLIHDDVFDRDTVRYGDLNISGRYRELLPQHLADAVAVMGGDITMGFGFSQIIEADFPAELRLKALRRVEQMIFEVVGGELLDVLTPTFELKDVTEQRLLATYTYKTASYSFEAPMQLGAILAEASEPTLEAISTFALPLGIAFQLADDLLGIYGNEEDIGKSVLSDIREGKRTLLVVKALESLHEDGQNTLNHILANPQANQTDLDTVRSLLEASGARRYVEELATAQVQRALGLIAKIGLDAKIQRKIESLAKFTISRSI